MTCKECIHYNVCEYHADELKSEGYRVDFDTRSDAEKVCGGFERNVKWISVEDRLPDKDDIYLVCLCGLPADFDRFVIYDDDDIENGFEHSKVTHWLPIPEAPMMKGGAE